jgi:hypothetical protein
MLNRTPRWNGSPEQYLAMVQYMAQKNNPQYDLREFLQWGEVMQKVMIVKLAPYNDFRDLLERGTPDYSIVSQLDKRMQELNNQRELKVAIYGPKADTDVEDILNDGSEGSESVRNMIKELSKHVRFPDEDQRKIDRL